MGANKLTFAIYGCGMIANVHAKALAEIKHAKLLYCADRKYQFAKNFASIYNLKAYETYEELLENPEIDIIIICTPNSTHADYAIQALKAGKNVVLEKPMALTVKDCDRIIEACKESDGKLTVISQFRMGQDIVKAKQIIDSGKLGKIICCDLHMKYYRDEDYYKNSWHGTKKYDGGGAIMNQGIHGIDLLQYLAGPVKSVKSYTKTAFHDIEVEDISVSSVEFQSGALGTIIGSTATYPGLMRKIEINGTEGYITLTENLITRLYYDGKKLIKRKNESLSSAAKPDNLEIDNHKIQLQNFVNAILGKEENLIDEYEGKKAVEIIEMIYNAK